MKTISNYVPALRTMQQDKTAANPHKTNQHEKNCYKVDGTSRITTESIAAEFILCPNLCGQQWLINEQVSKKYSKSQPKAGKYLLKKGSKMKPVSNYVPALRTMQQDKTAANPHKTNQHEENCYKVDGHKSIHYRKHCSRIHSVSKFVLTTAVDKCTPQ